jgi:chloramphenicol-sensitive protein RarD
MTTRKQGIINAVIAYILWGVYPLYWQMLQVVSPTEILINRMVWSFLTLFLIIIGLRLFKSLKNTVIEIIKDKKKLTLLIVAAALLSMNWFVFTFAIVSERIIEASLGYYINPILNILIGVIILKEKLNRYQAIAAGIVTVAVLFLTITYGSFPWIAIVLALSFGCYGIAKKFIQVDPFFSLFLETTLMLPLSTFFFSLWLINGTSAFLQPNNTIIFLLMGAGFITISPLFFFAKAIKQLPLSLIGFLQYIGPSISMVVAIFVLGENFTRQHLITFGLIWIACLLFSTSHLLPQNSPRD